MSYDVKNATQLAHLKSLAVLIRTLIQVLDARYDANVTASTDSDADYAAEVVDARVDNWGNICGSLGTNIRDGQSRLSVAIETAQVLLQAEIDEVSNARLENTLNIADGNEIRRRELAKEAEYRMTDDDSLQRQINSLSEAVLGILATISENREKIGGIS